MRYTLQFGKTALAAGVILSVCLAGCDSGSVEVACSSAADCDDGQTCFRSQCLPACNDADDCADGQGCREGVCLDGVSGECETATDCINPPTACSLAEGATCSGGVCEYPERSCDTPDADRCIDDGAILVRSLAPGRCDAGLGECVYEEERIAVDPENCETIATQGCSAVQCRDTDCAVNGIPDLDSPSCQCEYAELFDTEKDCSDEALLCATESRCDGAGNCVGTSLVGADDPCQFEGRLVEALDDAGRPRELREDEDRELVPMPFCDSDARCIECTAENGEERCNDGNPCTQDVCEDGLCKNFTEPQETLACTLDETTGELFGDGGICAEGACLQCDSSLADAAVRDQACERLDINGNLDVCLVGSSCEDNSCTYDAEGDPNFGESCRRAGDLPGVCSRGSCVECNTAADCADDGNPCTDAACEANVCIQVNNDDNVCFDGDGDVTPNFCISGLCIACEEGDLDADGAPIPAPTECNRWEPAIAQGGEPECRLVADTSQTSCDTDNLCNTSVCVAAPGGQAACQLQSEIDCRETSTGDGSCRNGTCNPDTGECNIRVNEMCDDGDPCRYGETCRSDGRCLASNSVTCTDEPGCGDRLDCNNTATCERSSGSGRSCSGSGGACGGTCSSSGTCVANRCECPGGAQCCSIVPCGDGFTCVDGKCESDCGNEFCP